MKPILAPFVSALVATVAQAGATLKDARKEYQEGNYAEAREMYQTLVKNPKTRFAATLGLSKALEIQGEYDKAQQVIESLLKEEPKKSGLFARLAELHHTLGRFEEAEKDAHAALA